jgi:hypothetical protein
MERGHGIEEAERHEPVEDRREHMGGDEGEAQDGEVAV